MIVSLAGCINPFAPQLDQTIGNDGFRISDQSSVEGVFENLKYAYTFKDTTIYGNLLASDFIFTYFDYKLNHNVSWGRDEEMRATDGLFSNTQRLDLIWNRIVSISGDSTNIVRSFNLTVTFNPTDIENIDGRVNMILKKSGNKWQITRWNDESNF